VTCRFFYVDLAYVSSHWRYIGLRLCYEFYDIACQWILGLSKRLQEGRAYFDRVNKGFVDRVPETCAAVGAWHAVVHQKACQMIFDIRIQPGTGMSYGDNLEGHWGVQNRIAPMIVEMGPGSREDHLSYQFNDHNERKERDLGVSKVTTRCFILTFSQQWH